MRTLTTVFAWLVLAALVVLSIRGIVDPGPASAAFGVQAVDLAGEMYFQVYRSRNLVLALTGMIFLAFGMWRAAAIIVTVCFFFRRSM